MCVPSAWSQRGDLAKVPQRAYLDLSGATAWIFLLSAAGEFLTVCSMPSFSMLDSLSWRKWGLHGCPPSSMAFNVGHDGCTPDALYGPPSHYRAGFVVR